MIALETDTYYSTINCGYGNGYGDSDGGGYGFGLAITYGRDKVYTNDADDGLGESPFDRRHDDLLMISGAELK